MAKQEDGSRRSFIKQVGMVGAGMAATGAFAATAAAAPSQQAWDVETDIVIVGSGYAGLCAAIEAADAGAKCIIVEKEPLYGGNSILCAGNSLFSGTHVQARNGIEDHPDWQYEDQMKYGEHRAVPELLRTFVDNGADTVLWLEKLGLVWRDTLGSVDNSNRAPRAHNVAESPNYPGNRGSSTWLVLYKACQERGVPVQLNTKMTKIIRPEPGGPVTGIEVEVDGKKQTIKAKKAVLLASGGWKSNVQMRVSWDPRLDADLSAGGLPFVQTDGSGTVAAIDAGAALTDMSFVCELRFKWGTAIYQTWEPPTLETVPGGAGLSISDYHRVMIVQNDGKRFVDEMGAVAYPQKPFYDAYLNLPTKPRNVWAVTDAAGAKALKWTAEIFNNPTPLVAPALSADRVAMADTLEALAAKMGVPAEGLAASVERFNACIDLNEDPDFGKEPPYYRLTEGPYFAAKAQFFAHDQMGGIRANTKGQVIELSGMMSGNVVSIDEEPVIPHLYAAGEVVGGYVGAERGHGKISIYQVFGRIAGKAAAAEPDLP
jgi:flavocytochrome c